MAIIRYDHYCGEDKYSDGSVEDYLLDLVKNQVDITGLAQEDKTYPVVYHLSHLRENIINWYPIGKNQTVLEIGAGCGAITRALCRRAKHVVSVELSKKRAQINFHRNIDVDNLTIYVGNQNDIDFDEKFDYVILNGVFEYAISFTEGPDPYRAFLEKARSFLKEDGKLLIAIENRLGLKYFTGSAEDHTGNYFVGLNQYPGNNTVRTFSKSEWIQLLDSCGLKYKFYYPYPDYKFPVEIFTDKTLVRQGYGKGYFNLEKNRYGWLQEQDLAKTLVKEGVMSSFANSFLLEISAKENFAAIDYCKISCDRKKNTRVVTVIAHDADNTWVEKQAANEDTILHIKQLYKNSIVPLTDYVRNLPGRYEDDKVIFPFVCAATFSDKLLFLLGNNEIDKVKEEVRDFFNQYFSALQEVEFTQGPEFCEVFGSEVNILPEKGVLRGNIDLIFENLYCVKTGFQIIDPEWVFPFAIPKTFVIWRAVCDFYEKNPQVENQLGKNALLTYLDVDPVQERAFSSWNRHFVYQWLKGSSLESFAKPISAVSMDQMVSLLRTKTMLSCGLYYDCGEGYSEGRKLVAEVPLLEGSFKVVFDLSKIENLKALRFDPIEGYAVRCSICSDQSELTAMNAWCQDDGFDIFMTDDPMYQISIPEATNSRVTITGKLFLLTDREKFVRYQEALYQKESTLQKTQDMLSQTKQALDQCQSEKAEFSLELEQTRAECYKKQAQLECILQTKGWKIYEAIRKIFWTIKSFF